MKILILYLFLFAPCLKGFSQKKVLDHSDYGIWPGSDRSSFSNTIVSDDGQYIVYFVGAIKGGFTMTIQAIKGDWKKVIPGVRTANLLNDEILIYTVALDSLVLYNLNSKSSEVIGDVQSYKVPESKVGWVAYSTKDSSVIIRNVSTSQEKRYTHVLDYYLNPAGESLLLSSVQSNAVSGFYLTKIDLDNFDTQVVYKGKSKVESLVFDGAGEQFAFFVNTGKENASNYQIMYFNPGIDSSIVLVNSNLQGFNSNLKIVSYPAPKFSRDGKRLFFDLLVDENTNETESDSVVKVDVWHYLDKRLQSEQQKQQVYVKYANAVMNLVDKNVFIVRDVDDDIYSMKVSNDGNGDFALVFSSVNDNEKYWNKLNRPNVYLVSLNDGSRKIILEHTPSVEVEDINFSPGGNYVYWSDRQKEQYFTLNVHTGVIKVITSQFPVALFGKNTFPTYSKPFGVAAWSDDDSAIFIYDNFDLWQVDANGRKVPVNVTQHYGRKHNLKFHLQTMNYSYGPPPVIHKGDKLFLKASNLTNLNNGLFQLQYSEKGGVPELLTMGPCDYTLVGKASKGNVYIVKRVSTSEAPNLFSTHTFHEFFRISDIQPQREYNWMTAEVVRWKMFDGKEGEGFLFKPENFDPQKKYPVIVNFYQYPGVLHNFRYPEPSNGEINIPYFVSNGYIVFRPGIQFTAGMPGYSAYNSIVSAVKFLSRFYWFDSSRIGLSGVSYGGYQINYLVTQTNIFAAAAPAAGMTDLVSDYNGLWNEMSKQFMYERSQGRIGASLWEKPDLYIQNSPIFKANKVQTPLLILQNKNDEAVAWLQGVEWFTALRRLGKRAWMLQYDGEEHGLGGSAAKLDYSIRIAQFFDHYLKGKPVPKWMSKGIPAEKKGRDTGLEMDNQGYCSSTCRTCKKLNTSLKKSTPPLLSKKQP